MTGEGVFFLGGGDLEMAAIGELLRRCAPGRVQDDALAWGARASAYADRIQQALQDGRTVVLVELTDDLGLTSGASRDRVVVVDHHGPLAGRDRPTSLEQVFTLLGRPAGEWTRWHTLVAANDRGHVRALEAVGASPAEIAQVRAADRAAQGITSEQEAAGRRAAEQAETVWQGALTVVELPHDRTATVTDVLDRALGGPGYQNLLVLGPHSTTFFGVGEAVAALAAAWPDGYYGGELPERGFWGGALRHSRIELLAVLAPALGADTGAAVAGPS